MKKKGFLTCLTVLLTLGGVWAYSAGGTATDPLVSLDYLQNIYLPTLMEQVEAQVEVEVSASYEEAAAKVDAQAGTGGGASEPIAAQRGSRGDTITLSEGSVLVVSAGTLSASVTGSVLVDATDGTEGVERTLSAGHRYIAGEGAKAAVTVQSDAASVLLEGMYSYRSAGRTTTPFTDLISTDWYYDYVLYAYQEGLLNGVSADRFSPKTTVTRAMLATVLYRMAGEPSASSVPPLDDIPVGLWYSKPVTWASDAGIVSGVGEGRYAPESSVTREQMAVMLRNYAATWLVEDVSLDGDLSAFPDSGQSSDWAREALVWAVDQGILNGKSDGRLDPGGSASRAEICAMLQRFLAAYP